MYGKGSSTPLFPVPPSGALPPPPPGAPSGRLTSLLHREQPLPSPPLEKKAPLTSRPPPLLVHRRFGEHPSFLLRRSRRSEEPPPLPSTNTSPPLIREQSSPKPSLPPPAAPSSSAGRSILVVAKVRGYRSFACPLDIDRWITFLSTKGIREFIFDKWRGEKYKMHSCLFTCQELHYLEMSGSILIPHASFSGPMNLKALVLENVSFSNNGLNNLIYNCPLLNTLTLRDIIGCTHLKLHAPNLVDLTVDCACIYISLEETPVLANVCIDLLEHGEGNQNSTNGATCKLVDILCGLPAIRNLDLIDRTYQNLCAGHSPVRLPIACPLSYLFININFADMRQLSAALCIFRSSSLLWTVDIKSVWHSETEEKSIEGFWEAQEDFNGLFSQLQTLCVYEVMGTKAELKFIEFVLANAPVLELVRVAFERGVDETKMLRKLVRFRRISSKAEIEVPEEAMTIG